MSEDYTESWVDAGSVRLHVMDWGGDGRACVLVHPTGFVGQVWKPYVDALKPRFRCITTDRRGHGLSDKPESRYDWITMSDDLSAVLDAYGVTGALGIGHSAGATDIAITAARRPDAFADIVLLDPIIFEDPPELAEDGFPAHPMARGALKRRAVWPSRAEVLASYASRQPFQSWDQRFLEQYVQYGFLDREDGQVELACPPQIESLLYGQNQEFGIWELLGEVRARTLLLGAEDSNAFPPEKFDRASKTLRQSRSLMLKDANHFFPFEEPAKVIEEIERFLG